MGRKGYGKGAISGSKLSLLFFLFLQYVFDLNFIFTATDHSKTFPFIYVFLVIILVIEWYYSSCHNIGIRSNHYIYIMKIKRYQENHAGEKCVLLLFSIYPRHHCRITGRRQKSVWYKTGALKTKIRLLRMHSNLGRQRSADNERNIRVVRYMMHQVAEIQSSVVCCSSHLK